MQRLPRIISLSGLMLAAACQLIPGHSGKPDEFFTDAEAFRQHYTEHEVAFNTFAKVMDLYPPLGDNNVCVTPRCVELQKTKLDIERERELLTIQADFHTRLIDSLGYSKRVFLFASTDGYITTIPYSFDAGTRYVNVTLHYNGDTPPDLKACHRAPKKDKGGTCALTLSETWFLQYAWLPKSAFDPPAGTAEADCDEAKYESFSAYTACLKNSKAPRAEPLCDGAAPPDEMRKCLDGLIDEWTGR